MAFFLPKKEQKEFSTLEDFSKIVFRILIKMHGLTKTIEMKVNNSDGGSFENSMQAAIMDA